MIDRPLTDVRHHSGNASSSSAHYFSRYDEIIELYSGALTQPGLSTKAKQLGNANLATTHYVYGRELAKAGRPFAAVVQFGRMAWADPLYCLQRASSHGTRPFVPQADNRNVSAP
jgi:hypothetical protein